jgi:hypothetical protein
MGWRDAPDTGSGVPCKPGVLWMGCWWVGGSDNPVLLVVVGHQEARNTQSSCMNIEAQVTKAATAAVGGTGPSPCQRGVVVFVGK